MRSQCGGWAIVHGVRMGIGACSVGGGGMQTGWRCAETAAYSGSLDGGVARTLWLDPPTQKKKAQLTGPPLYQSSNRWWTCMYHARCGGRTRLPFWRADSRVRRPVFHRRHWTVPSRHCNINAAAQASSRQ